MTARIGHQRGSAGETLRRKIGDPACASALQIECLVKGESEADLVNFGKRLRAQLAPVGELELLLADRIVSSAWRLRRLVSVETILFNTEGPTLAHAFNRLGREQMSVLSRYEVTLERSLYRALHELQRLQAARNGQAVPPPAVLDVDVSVCHPSCSRPAAAVAPHEYFLLNHKGHADPR